MEFEFLDLAQAKARVGLKSTAGFYAGISAGLYPQPLKVGIRAVRWRSDELDAAMRALPRATIGSQENRDKQAAYRAGKAARSEASAA